MLVPKFNAVKVESVPLKSDEFRQSAASGPTQHYSTAKNKPPTFWCLSSSAHWRGAATNQASSLLTGPVKLRAGDVSFHRSVRERNDERLHRMLAINEDGPVLRVELNRPESLNCLDDDVLLEVTDLYTRLQQRFDLKAVVLGGRGRAFCAGADLRNPPGFAGTGGRERRYHSQIGYRACQAIADCEVVTIARLHGHVVGGGFALALACDFRVAAADTRVQTARGRPRCADDLGHDTSTDRRGRRRQSTRNRAARRPDRRSDRTPHFARAPIGRTR